MWETISPPQKNLKHMGHILSEENHFKSAWPFNCILSSNQTQSSLVLHPSWFALKGRSGAFATEAFPSQGFLPCAHEHVVCTCIRYMLVNSRHQRAQTFGVGRRTFSSLFHAPRWWTSESENILQPREVQGLRCNCTVHQPSLASESQKEQRIYRGLQKSNIIKTWLCRSPQ